jgi:cell division protein ZapA
VTAKPAAPAEATVTLEVSLLGREYKVTCRESERTQLLDAVAFLDRRMREIRDAGKIAGTERIAVMAALNIAHELLRTRGEPTSAKPARASAPIDDAVARRRIEAMRAAIDQALGSEAKQAAGRS